MIGIGNALRGDDAAGLEVVRRLSGCDLPPGLHLRALEGEPLGLLDLWSDTDAAIVVDAVRSGAPAGTIHRVEVSSAPLPAQFRTSSHTVTAAEAIELARQLGKLPAKVVVFGIEGADFKAGSALDESVRRAVLTVSDAVRREALALL